MVQYMAVYNMKKLFKSVSLEASLYIASSLWITDLQEANMCLNMSTVNLE